MSNVCEATPIKSLFWNPNGLNKLLEMCFEFRSNLIGKLMMAFWTGQSQVCTSYPDTQVGAQNNNFGSVSQMDYAKGWLYLVTILFHNSSKIKNINLLTFNGYSF